jgi:hypothetical protein
MNCFPVVPTQIPIPAPRKVSIITLQREPDQSRYLNLRSSFSRSIPTRRFHPSLRAALQSREGYGPCQRQAMTGSILMGPLHWFEKKSVIPTPRLVVTVVCSSDQMTVFVVPSVNFHS